MMAFANISRADLIQIRDALAEIIEEAPTSEPIYPRGGCKRLRRKLRQAWAYDSARWESAQAAERAYRLVLIALDGEGR